jgi:hypothetical protein
MNGLLLAFIASGCTSIVSEPKPRPTTLTVSEVEVAFHRALDDVRRCQVLPDGLTTANWRGLTVPVSAEDIINAGPTAIPLLEQLRGLPGVECAALADACISVISAKKVVRGKPFLSRRDHTQFVTYTVWN